MTPGVATAPVALSGAIVAGVAWCIDMLSAHADVLGVGITAAGHITRAVVAHYCGTTFIDVVDRDDASDPIRDDSHSNCGHHDRERLANVRARHSLDHRM